MLGEINPHPSSYYGNVQKYGGRVLLGTQTLRATTTHVDFYQIDSSFRHLEIQQLSRTNASATFDTLYLQFNNDSGGNYDRQYIGARTGAVTNLSTSQTRMEISSIAGSFGTANVMDSSTILIPNYRNTTFFKTVVEPQGNVPASSGNSSAFLWVGTWRSTAPITQVSIITTVGLMIVGCQFHLYGIR